MCVGGGGGLASKFVESWDGWGRKGGGGGLNREDMHGGSTQGLQTLWKEEGFYCPVMVIASQI